MIGTKRTKMKNRNKQAKVNIKNLRGSAFGLRLRTATSKNFTNKVENTKWGKDIISKPKSQYVQTYSHTNMVQSLLSQWTKWASTHFGQSN